MASQPIDCPCCGSQMLPHFVDSTELDLCPDCGGLWFDGGELERVVGRPLPGTKVTPQFRRCPRCDEKMERVMIGHTGVERCECCSGYYLDAGELEQILRSARDARLAPPAAPVAEAAAGEEPAPREFVCCKCGRRFPNERGYAIPNGKICDGCSGMAARPSSGPFERFLERLAASLPAHPRYYYRRY